MAEEKTLDDLKQSLKDALPSVQSVILNQSAIAMQNLAEVGGEAANLGLAVLQQLSAVGNQVMAGEISDETAELAINNYLESLKLLSLGVAEKAKAEALQTAIKILTELKNIALALIGVAASVGLAEATSFADSLKPKVT
jgi:hypothetical protein